LKRAHHRQEQIPVSAESADAAGYFMAERQENLSARSKIALVTRIEHHDPGQRIPPGGQAKTCHAIVIEQD